MASSIKSYDQESFVTAFNKANPSGKNALLREVSQESLEALKRLIPELQATKPGKRALSQWQASQLFADGTKNDSNLLKLLLKAVKSPAVPSPAKSSASTSSDTDHEEVTSPVAPAPEASISAASIETRASLADRLATLETIEQFVGVIRETAGRERNSALSKFFERFPVDEALVQLKSNLGEEYKTALLSWMKHMLNKSHSNLQSSILQKISQEVELKGELEALLRRKLKDAQNSGNETLIVAAKALMARFQGPTDWDAEIPAPLWGTPSSLTAAETAAFFEEAAREAASTRPLEGRPSPIRTPRSTEEAEMLSQPQVREPVSSVGTAAAERAALAEFFLGRGREGSDDQTGWDEANTGWGAVDSAIGINSVSTPIMAQLEESSGAAQGDVRPRALSEPITMGRAHRAIYGTPSVVGSEDEGSISSPIEITPAERLFFARVSGSEDVYEVIADLFVDEETEEAAMNEINTLDSSEKATAREHILALLMKGGEFMKALSAAWTLKTSWFGFMSDLAWIAKVRIFG